MEDDREWDLDNLPRRAEYPEFTPNQYEVKSYGAGLPLDLRIKLGILRLNLSSDHVDEALVSRSTTIILSKAHRT